MSEIGQRMQASNRLTNSGHPERPRPFTAGALCALLTVVIAQAGCSDSEPSSEHPQGHGGEAGAGGEGGDFQLARDSLVIHQLTHHERRRSQARQVY